MIFSYFRIFIFIYDDLMRKPSAGKSDHPETISLKQ